jgi:hypothetical protein
MYDFRFYQACMGQTQLIKLIKMAPQTRLENTQPPLTVDGIFLVIVDELQQMNQWHLC